MRFIWLYPQVTFISSSQLRCLMILVYNFHTAYMTADKTPICESTEKKKKRRIKKEKMNAISLMWGYATQHMTELWQERPPVSCRIAVYQGRAAHRFCSCHLQGGRRHPIKSHHNPILQQSPLFISPLRLLLLN